MNQITNVNTMTSLEVAELTGEKTRSNFKRC